MSLPSLALTLHDSNSYAIMTTSAAATIPPKLRHPEHAELPAIPGGWDSRVYEIGGRQFNMVQPKRPDDFLDDPDVNARHVADDYMPYWSYLWPTSLEVGQLLLSQTWPAGMRTLEIGSGIGLTGVIALAAGLDVTFSDYDEESLTLAGFNARRNGCSDPKTMVLDWRRLPSGLSYPFILGCEVIYERKNHQPIINLLDQLLAPGGEAWIADPGRHTAHLFVADARAAGYRCEETAVPRIPFPERPEGVTYVWKLSRAQ